MKAIVRSVCFKCALALVFLRFSLLHETFTFLTGINLYVLYLLAPVVLFGVVAFGGLPRTLRQLSSLFWVVFVVWMVLAVPFSSWRGDSFKNVVTYVRTDFIMLFVTAGLAKTWADCRKLMYAIAAGAIVNLATAHLFIHSVSGDRFGMESNGLISNPNDLAAHLLLVLPFLLFIALKPRARMFSRIFVSGAIALGLFQILRSGSRGALVALVFTVIFVLVRGSARQRIAVGVAAPVVLAVLIGLLPGSTWDRLTSVVDSKAAPEEALASTADREYLLRQSIAFTFEHPLFGVGPGQFLSYEGESRLSEGLKGSWHQTHNSYTQISSECGIPALLFYLTAAIATFLQLGRIRQKAAAAGEYEIATAAFCITIGLVGYSVAATFVNFGYMFYFPAISGLVSAIWLALLRCSRRPGTSPSEPTIISSADAL